MRVYISEESFTENSEYSEERYGSWSRDDHYSITCASATKKLFSTEFELDVSVGDVVFVVYVVYSSGDSFGTSTGNGDIVCVYKDAEKAVECMRTVEKCQNSYSITLLNNDDEPFTYGNPAAGYFESLTSCEIQTLVVEE